MLSVTAASSDSWLERVFKKYKVDDIQRMMGSCVLNQERLILVTAILGTECALINVWNTAVKLRRHCHN